MSKRTGLPSTRTASDGEALSQSGTPVPEPKMTTSNSLSPLIVSSMTDSVDPGPFRKTGGLKGIHCHGSRADLHQS
jgi:hypothetical protein